MKCKVCGAESGKYPLCRDCNIKKEKGEVIKCARCGNWHYAADVCPKPISENGKYLYEIKQRLVSKSEEKFYVAIKQALPANYFIFPQINLASIIDRTDDARFRNELNRIVDFLVTDSSFTPKFIIEINDQTHLTSERKERDEKVQKICEEAGIPILKFWTSYGVNYEYISKKTNEVLQSLPVDRVRHFSREVMDEKPAGTSMSVTKKSGCYIATCVYGAYDCPQVWVLRRYRDTVLLSTWAGRIFVKTYYAFSPIVVKLLGEQRWFIGICVKLLNRFVQSLKENGFQDTPYSD